MTTNSKSPSTLLDIGEQAPLFSLQDQDGNTVTRQDHLGKKNVVLVFYPGDSTPGCTKQLCAVRDDYSDFIDTDIAVYGVNPQKAQSHRKFIDKHSFPFALLVDHDKEVVSAYGCKGTLMTKRTVYGINKEGIIVLAKRGTPANSEIIQAFK